MRHRSIFEMDVEVDEDIDSFLVGSVIYFLDAERKPRATVAKRKSRKTKSK